MKEAKEFLDKILKENEEVLQKITWDTIIFGRSNPAEFTEDGKILYKSIWGDDSKKVVIDE